MPSKVENANIEILKQCREQIGLTISEVEKKVKKIADIENGIQKPTFKQLNSLARMYRVPRWVFTCENLPEKYQFLVSVPVFRQFANSEPEIFSDYKVRSLTAKVESYRELIIDFYKDMDEEFPLFNPPELNNIQELSNQVREWLNATELNYSFPDWKKKLEEKGVFIFMTSRYKGWSYIDKEIFRGLSIYHPILPIIIINDSDAFKAQSFTLFHELGHLIKKESAIDRWTDYDENIEKWCDEFSGNLLMPEKPFKNSIENIEFLSDVKKLANRFNVSAYACLVRLRDLKIITQSKYYLFEKQLKDEYRDIAKKMKESAGGLPRNRPKEVLNQYGNIYSTVVFQAFHNQEIGLTKLCQLLDLKNPKYALQIEGHL